jgi:hypothetical protein
LMKRSSSPAETRTSPWSERKVAQDTAEILCGIHQDVQQCSSRDHCVVPGQTSVFSIFAVINSMLNQCHGNNILQINGADVDAD